ncbi:hypothetical protein [Roseovarius pacificus]|uniref:hypothetical protein n=1 Tax=Roseovarius pacificus TaxID=337701 RepID=UPI002A186A8F|nr:hypothetical protein [Roseovarius pacificus]
MADKMISERPALAAADLDPENDLLTIVDSSGNVTCRMTVSEFVRGGIVERDSNANGDYVRFADGTQICTHAAPVSYNYVTNLSGFWTFPAAFSQIPFYSGAVERTSFVQGVANAGVGDIGTLDAGGLSTTGVMVRINSINGNTGFADGDGATVLVTAIGRWF